MIEKSTITTNPTNNLEKDKIPGPSMCFENFHYAMDLTFCFWDRVKVLFGGKIDLSLCGKITVHLQQDKKYLYMKPGDVEPKVVVWFRDEPEMLNAGTRIAFSERHQQLTEKLRE